MSVRPLGRPPVSEFRQDPITGRWAIVAEGRGARPNDFATRPPPTAPKNCPFCEGNEGMTPPEVAAYRTGSLAPNAPGWTVRTIPNKFPTVAADAPEIASPKEAGETRRPGFGFHEVVIESPSHTSSLASLPDGQARAVWRMLRDRVRDLAARPKVRAVVAFENSGPESGGTLFHPHAQVVALADLPPLLAEEANGAARYARSHGGVCAFEAELARERERGVRVIFDSPELLAYAPYASGVPYEVRLLPARHSPSLGAATDREVDRLASLLSRLLRAIDSRVPGASYNLVTRAFAVRAPEEKGYHWHLDVLPRLVRPDGFEVGSGVPVNPLPPEVAARDLRDVLGTTGRSAAATA